MDVLDALSREYISAYADCLLKANDDPDSPAGKRLVRLLWDLWGLEKTMPFLQ